MCTGFGVCKGTAESLQITSSLGQGSRGWKKIATCSKILTRVWQCWLPDVSLLASRVLSLKCQLFTTYVIYGTSLYSSLNWKTSWETKQVKQKFMFWWFCNMNPANYQIYLNDYFISFCLLILKIWMKCSNNYLFYAFLSSQVLLSYLHICFYQLDREISRLHSHKFSKISFDFELVTTNPSPKLFSKF